MYPAEAMHANKAVLRGMHVNINFGRVFTQFHIVAGSNKKASVINIYLYSFA